MHTEYEVRVLEINAGELINKLVDLGADKIEDHYFRRYTYNVKPVQENKWIRLRTNGKKTTLTIKEVVEHSVSGTKELEVEVSDFDATNEILENLGYTYKSYQENKRVSYKLDNVMIEIDTWPLIPTYVEIEAGSEKEVYDMLERLGFKKEQACTLDVSSVYLKVYGINVDNIKELRFN